MSIFNRKPKIAEPIVEQREELSQQFNSFNPIYGTLNFTSFNSYTQTKSLKLSAVFRCIDLISNDIAVMEINNFLIKGKWKQKQKNTLYNLLNVQPNQYMSSFTFKKQMVVNMLMMGNAYILIRRDSNDEVNELVLLDPNTVQVLAINGEIKYNVISASYYNLPLVKPQVYDKSDIIHIMNFSLNNFVGVSTLVYGDLVMGTAYSSEVQANNYFTSNNILSGILRPTAGSHLTKLKADEAKAAFLANLNNGINTGSNSIIVLDSGLEYQSIQTSPKDSMLIENREFSALQICQLFGCPPNKIFLDKRNIASNNEAQQIEYLNSNLLPLIEKIEAEMFRKLVLPVDYDKVELKADVTNLLRLQASEQADVYVKLFGMGAITTNEIRLKNDADYPVVGGNDAYISTNLQKLSNPVVVGKQPAVSGDTTQIKTNGQQFVDNKLK